MTSSSTFVKAIETKNHTLALSLFRKYNSEDYPNLYATISKKKGGDKTITYVINIYTFQRTKGE